jgi:hypothetical protein
MALGNGQKWALYLLMGTHSNAPDGKSAFRTTVENNTPPGADHKPAFVAAAQAMDNSIQPGDIGNLPDLNPATLRSALQLAQFYPGGAGPCPNPGDQSAVYDTLSQNLA